MSETPAFVFMLPRLLEQGLCDDDSGDYALVTYPREVVSAAAKIIVADYANRMDSILLDRKKRVKTVMENLAVALSLEVEHVKLMETARKIYKKWMENPGMFGEPARQNRFMRRIIKQLSLPFEMRCDPSRDGELFRTEFAVLLNTILGDLTVFVENIGCIFSKETWITCLNVAIGITDALLEFNFENLMQSNHAAKLKQRAVNLCFTIIELCGLTDELLWDRLKMYCLKWSGDLDFVKIWGHHVDRMFVFMNIRIYKQPLDADLCPLKGGVYTPENPVSDDMVKFVFRKVHGMIDSRKTHEKPEILRELAMILSRLTANAQVIGTFDRSLSKKYSADAFLKLFGKFLTEVPLVDESFDEAVLQNVDSLLAIVSNFQIDYKNVAPRLIAYAIKRSTPEHMPIAAAFLNRAVELFRHNYDILPYIADHSLTIMPQLNATKAAKLVNDAFWSNVNSLFISVTELMKKCGQYDGQIAASFETIWKTTTLLPIRFQLLCYAPMADLNIIEKMLAIFSDGGIRQYTSDSSSVPYVASVLLLIGVIVRFESTFLVRMNESHLLKLILETTIKIDPHKVDNYDLVISAVLQMILNIITYCNGALNKTENVEAVLKYLSQLRPLVVEYRERDMTSVEYLIESLYDQIYAKMAVRIPAKDICSRRLNSIYEVSEKTVIDMFRFAEPRAHYFTIGKHILMSVIENSNPDDPILLFIRGAHGKSVFKVRCVENFSGASATLSSEITQVRLPGAESFDITAKQNGVQLGDVLSPSSLLSYDENRKSMYGSEFETWMGDMYNFCQPFESVSPSLRPRVVDFLAWSGLLSNKNINEVKMVTNMNKLLEVVRKLDMFDAMPLLPISICHLLPSDDNFRQTVIDYVPGETHQRMTPLMKKFLREIGEPFMMPPGVGILPPLRTTFPVITSLQSMIALLSPTIAETEDGAKKIYEIGETSSMKIIFNETSFDIRVEREKKPRQHVLSVTPTVNGLYHVTQLLVPKDVFSPFAEEQTMSAQTLAFFIAICFEQNIRTNAQRTMPNLSRLRRNMIASLAETEVCDPTLAASILA